MASFMTKSRLTGARSCGLRAYRNLALGEWGRYDSSPPSPLLAHYRARHQAAATVNRLWAKGGEPDRSVVPALWAETWQRAGGIGADDAAGEEWLQTYISARPFVTGRRILAPERTLTAPFGNQVFSARPDLLVEASDGAIEALELSSARHPLLDRQAVQTMVAIDQLVMQGPDLPAALRARDHHVVVCSLETFTEIDVTLTWSEAENVLNAILAWIDDVTIGYPAETRAARPGPETCERCPFSRDCDHAWRTDCQRPKPLDPAQIYTPQASEDLATESAS